MEEFLKQAYFFKWAVIKNIGYWLYETGFATLVV